jgi:hypothetical protein
MDYPPASYDLEEKNETFDETADPYAKGHGVKWQPDGRGCFPRDPIFIADIDETVSDEEKEDDAQNPGKDGHERLISFGKSVHKKIHENMLPPQGNFGYAEPDDQRQQQADDFICAHDRTPARPHNHISDGQTHHEGQGCASNNAEPLACLLKNAKHFFHLFPPRCIRPNSPHPGLSKMMYSRIALRSYSYSNARRDPGTLFCSLRVIHKADRL